MPVRVGVRQAGLSALLASTSVAGLLMGGSAPALAQCSNYINTTAAGCTNNGTISPSLIISNSTVNGDINNNGTIAPSGIVVENNSLVNGSIASTGTIIGGISIDQSSTVNNTGANSVAVLLGGTGTDSGNVSNAGKITMDNDFAETGIEVSTGGTFTGNIVNTGSINLGASGHAQNSVGIQVDNTNGLSTFAGAISNGGSITVNAVSNFGSCASYGIALLGNQEGHGKFGSFTGGITNGGSIVATMGGTGATNTAAGIIVSDVSTFTGGITNTSAGTIVATNSAATATAAGILVNDVVNFSGGINNAGSITGKVGILVTNSGPVSVFDSGTIIGTGGTAVDLTGNAAGNTFTLGPGYSITGLVKGQGADTFQLGGSGTGSFSLSGIDTQYTGFTTFNVASGTWTVTGATTRNWTIMPAGTLLIGSASTSIGNIADNGTLGFAQSGGWLYGGVISGTGMVEQLGPGTTLLTGANTYSGGTVVLGGTLALGGAGTLGAASGTTTIDSGGTLDLGGTTQTQATVNLAGGTLENGKLNAAIVSTGGTINGIGGTASLTTNAGTTFILGTNTFAGPATVNGGSILDVIGSMTDPTVNSGGTLTGTGTVGSTQVNAGGMFAPGNGTPGSSMTILGNLAFQSGALYLIQVNPATASFATVSGTAALGGATVEAFFANGSYVSKQYTILTANGGVSGTFNPTVVNTNLPSSFHTTLTYDPNHAYLNLVLSFSVPGGLNGNQQAVANALTNFFNANGSIPLLYGALTPAGLTQASGEPATGAQQTAFDAMDLFLGLMTDPFMRRGDGINGVSSPTGYADGSDEASAYAARRRNDAFAMFTKAPPAAAFVQRWSVWAAGYGGSQSTTGDPITGSHDTTSRIAGTAVGADYLFSPYTLAGFAVTGGGTSFSVNGLGSGRSDLFEAGAYMRHTHGPAYVTAAVAAGWHDVTTDRTVTIAGFDRLHAEFKANIYSGRVEGGYRLVAPWIGGLGITPYAAGQAITFDLPAYAETVLAGAANFALNYGAKSVTDSRTELGIRTDKSFAMANGIFTLRSRLAWAHDFDPNRSIAATFQALPGASFVVNGAAQAPESALTTASAEMKWTNGWSASATFEGQFSNVTRTYAGKGVVRYAW